MRAASLATLAVAATLLAACATDSNDPTGVRPQAAQIGDADRYIVLISNARNFESKVAALGGTISFMHEPTGFAVVEGLNGAAAGELAKANGVQSVKADASFTVTPAATVDAGMEGFEPSVNSQANPATAARYVWQWNMTLIGAPTAWAAGKLGSPNVTVAILDSGIDYDAPDLNGLVDLSRSKSFVPSDDAITSTYFPTRHPINDYHGHGTNVATQVSSKAVALAGVTSKTTLMGVKVLGASGSGSTAGVLSGVLWAADHGANIANMSLGGTFSKSVFQGFVAEINRIFNYANRQGMLIVVSAGNETDDLDHNANFYKAYCNASHVVCVSAVGKATATGSGDAPAYYTNFGRSAIDVAAPGGNADAANGFAASVWPWGADIASWVWSYCPKYRIAGFTAGGVPVLTACSAGNRLTGYIGTSQASPHVAGLAALLAAEGITNPADLKAAIKAAVDDLGQPGNDPFYGAGRINVPRALGL